jgi:hypothetical protein
MKSTSCWVAGTDGFAGAAATAGVAPRQFYDIVAANLRNSRGIPKKRRRGV